ncbi:MAG: hypothetical protein K8T10_05920 [Candidatus Eremiobacteraeota bacterium]|nr:hypothetical protein [Candidatus Eremiobacteraeota bacterium]
MRYWLDYDLGFKGNYDGLYKWLDNLGAKECGDSCATFKSDQNKDQIKNELSDILDSDARIYLINTRPLENMKRGGRFILGKRTVPPWSGYADVEFGDDEIDED